MPSRRSLLTALGASFGTGAAAGYIASVRQGLGFKFLTEHFSLINHTVPHYLQ